MITGKNIHKRYGKVEVLKGVDVEINKGEVVSIVGPSGSGKSTLLHILGTLDKADTGEVSMNNTIINSLSGKKLAAFRNKHIGFVFQFHHNKPDIIFADEPTGNLDSANAKELHQLFFDLRKQFNQTFLIVTHNAELAQLSDRVLHMKDGKIV